MTAAFDGPTLRVLKSDLYKMCIQHGWAWQVPYEFATLLCGVRGLTVHDLGLAWEITPSDVTKAQDMEVGVPTIPLLRALGYGTRWSAFIEWTLRRWP
jgi:hypothetical protein